MIVNTTQMRFILDANCLIYLIKTNLAELLYELSAKSVVIDTSVHKEVVLDGIKNNYPDAIQAREFLEKNQIPIISVNVSVDFSKFRDAGETSCYILAKQRGICISSDTRAIQKFNKHAIPCMQLDNFFFLKFLEGKITKITIKRILNDLKIIYATTSERELFFLMKINTTNNEGS